MPNFSLVFPFLRVIAIIVIKPNVRADVGKLVTKYRPPTLGTLQVQPRSP